ERYPGTENSYSAFMSKVTVLDEQSAPFDYDIYMNHILNHKGYRFFQSSFDGDEKGTILSVNHDSWGTWITYAGYFLLYLGLLAILFAPNTRFSDLRHTLRKIKDKKAKLAAVVVLLFGLQGMAQEEDHGNHSFERPSKAQIDSVLQANMVSKDHA